MKGEWLIILFIYSFTISLFLERHPRDSYGRGLHLSLLTHIVSAHFSPHILLRTSLLKHKTSFLLTLLLKIPFADSMKLYIRIKILY